ncbi:MAG: hypothetical protein ACFBSG_20920 [Leptolyngbyaceae cyanobacterium]
MKDTHVFSPNSRHCDGNCHFVQDRRDADRYTCLPCGKVRRTSNENPLEVVLAFFLALIVIAVLLSGCSLEPTIEEAGRWNKRALMAKHQSR